MSDGRGVGPKSLMVVVAIVALLVVGPIATASFGADRATRPVEQHQQPALTVTPHPDGTTEIWPYTSRRKSFDSATLPINVVILADPRMVRNILTIGPDSTWENQTRGLNESDPIEGIEEDESARVSVNGTGIRWREAEGADRYTYIRHTQSVDGRWLDESYQLHDGDYFGSRYHVRFYEVPDEGGAWTALQVHREHWDWFRLRHTVGSLPSAQHHVEKEFYDRWYVTDIRRQRFTDGGILNSDGWATVIELRFSSSLDLSPLPSFVLVGTVAVGSIGAWLSSIRYRRLRTLAEDPPVEVEIVYLALSLVAVPLLVRYGGLAVEAAGVVSSPKVVAATFYPLIAIGTPVVAYTFSRGLAPRDGFVSAAAGFAFGLLADYLILGIAVIPIEVIVHRTVLVVAVGLVAAGGAGGEAFHPTWRRWLLVGVGVWVAGLLWSLFLM